MKTITTLFVLIFLSCGLGAQSLALDLTQLNAEDYHISAPGYSSLESNDLPRSYGFSGPGECLIRIAPNQPNGHKLKFHLDSLGPVFPISWQKNGDEDWQELPDQFFTFKAKNKIIQISQLPEPGDLPRLYGLIIPQPELSGFIKNKTGIDSIPGLPISLGTNQGLINFPRLNTQLNLAIVPINIDMPGYLPEHSQGQSANDQQSQSSFSIPAVQLGLNIDLTSQPNQKTTHPKGYENPESDSSKKLVILPLILPSGNNDSEKSTQNATPNYILLRRKLDGGYVKLDQHQLYFKYEGEYNAGDLSVKVYDMQRASISLTNQAPLQKYNGDNRLHLDLNGILPGFYTLEITNEKSEHFFLRFEND